MDIQLTKAFPVQFPALRCHFMIVSVKMEISITCNHHATQQFLSWSFIPEKRRLTFYVQKCVHKCS